MRILITGATGYLGQRLCRTFRDAGHCVIAGIRFGSQIENLRRYMDGHIAACYLDESHDDLTSNFERWQIDTVINCACDYGRTNATSDTILDANLVMPLRVLEAASKSGVRTFINAGTSLDVAVSSYARSKRQFVDWLQANIAIPKRINLELEHFYGPSESSTKFVAWLIDQFFGSVPTLELTAGEQQRDFVYIDDLLAAFSTVLHHAERIEGDFQSFQVGSGETIRVRDLVEQLQQLCGASDVQLYFGAKPYRANEQMHSRADIKALESIGWRPHVSLTDGLQRCIESRKTKQIEAYQTRKAA